MTEEILTADISGERADVFLSKHLDGMTRSSIQKLLEQGNATCNGTALKKNSKLSSGDVITIYIPDPELTEIVPQDIPLDVVFEDSDVIVINKPVGMVVHPAPGHPDNTLVNALLYHCGDSLSGINGEIRPGIVHRIDRDTSGLLIVAKNDAAHLSLANQLSDHSLYREYEGICVGNLKEDTGTVDAPIGRHTTDRKKMAITPTGRNAITHYTVLERFRGYCHAQFRLETGRTHQIRVHMAHLGHPLLGDIVYGNKKPVQGLAGQCLHARKLTFTHPRTGELMTVECPLPDYFTAILTKLRNIE